MNRFAFIFKRLLFTIPLLAGIVFVVFSLLQVTPGDPARQIIGLRATEAELAETRADLGLDDSVPEQYVRYLNRVVQGDLGYSYKTRQPVSELIGERLEVTAGLLGLAALTTVAFAVPLAVLSARRRNGLIDHVVRFTGTVGLAMPPFWIGVMLLLVVALPTGWLPVGGYGDTPIDKLRSLVLPALTLAIGMTPVMVRSLRSTIGEVLGSEQVMTARSLGLSEGRILRKFVLRNAAAPSVTILALELGYLLFGAVVVETTFALPGLGQGLVLAARSRDFAAVQGYTLVFALAVVIVFLVADVVTAALDPRVRIST